MVFSILGGRRIVKNKTGIEPSPRVPSGAAAWLHRAIVRTHGRWLLPTVRVGQFLGRACAQYSVPGQDHPRSSPRAGVMGDASRAGSLLTEGQTCGPAPRSRVPG